MASITDAFMAADSGMIIVSFSGTEPFDVVDFLTDAEMLPAPGPFQSKLRHSGPDAKASIGDIHAGFQRAIRSIWPSILRHIADLDRTAGTQRPVYLTGHSLGGGLALMAAVLAAADDPDWARARIHGVYTYGQSMIGDGALAWKAAPVVGDRLYRHVNEGDLGPTLPDFLEEYVHFGTEIRFQVTAEDLYEHWRGWQYARMAGGLTRLMLWFTGTRIVAHYPDAYVIGALRGLDEASLPSR